MGVVGVAVLGSAIGQLPGTFSSAGLSPHPAWSVPWNGLLTAAQVRAAEPANAKAPAKVKLSCVGAAIFYVDGTKVGAAPSVDIEVAAGSHQLRIDCQRKGEPPIIGKPQRLSVGPGAVVDFDFSCQSNK